MPTLLVVDDDRAVLGLVEQAFSNYSISVLTAGTVAEGLELVESKPDVVLLDIALPDASGLDAARRIIGVYPTVPIIFITIDGSSDTAIEAMKLGAYDYQLKPLDVEKLRQLVERALKIRQLTDRFGNDREQIQFGSNILSDDSSEGHTPQDGNSIIGRSAKIQEVFKAIGRVAPQNVTVLIVGESGTGKELVARAIVQHSPRREKPFLAVNCAAIPETLLESELFGHEKGAFTGAHQRRIGKFEQSSGGTIFLDEVGDMSPLVQSKVLRVLQEQEFERVGGTESIHTDVRVISATNRNLQRLVADGEFREDLYYRLNGFTITVPPLRERGDDIAILLEYCLRRFNRELGKNVRGFSPDALQVLLDYSWPGNVRELESTVRRCLLQSTGPLILREFLPPLLMHTEDAIHPAHTECGNLASLLDQALRRPSGHIYAEALQEMEKYVLTRVLRHTHGVQSQAARMLGITRTSLRRKLHAHGIALDPSISLKGGGDSTNRSAMAST
jgi:two-component system nitrogen regulation response regulator GlnG